MDNGTQIGPYRIEGLLGRGGMAEVYKAWHEGLHRHEALKALPPHMAFDHSFVERFLAEARMAAGLQHPHIATIHTVSDAQAAQPYFTMELIEGGDLSDLLHQRGRLSLAEALPILRQIAQALDYAHAHGIVHRDVKPGNVLLKDDGHGGWTIKVVDFGIARAQEAPGGTRLTKTGMIVGTPEYMSPEQGGSGQTVDQRTDLYSLGVIAYEMLCGQPPFHAETNTSPLSIIMQHVRDAPRPPVERAPGVPAAANNAILRALAKSPADRFSSCSAFVEALSSAVPVAPPVFPPVSTTAPPSVSPLGTVITGKPGASKWSKSLALPGFAAFAGAALIGWAVFKMPSVPRAAIDIGEKGPLSELPTPAPGVSATQVTVPEVINMKEDQARDFLNSKGLRPEVTTGSSPVVAAGLVMSQYPPANAAVSKDATVRVRVSTGPSAEDLRRQEERRRQDEQERLARQERAAQAEAARRRATMASEQTRPEIEAAIDGWKSSWERQDVDGHMSHYTGDATIYSNGSWTSYSRYYADRREKFALGGNINVSITSPPDIEVDGDTATVRFRMAYTRRGSRSDLTRSGRQKFKMRRIGGQWLIYEDVFTKS